ncbi:DUF2917 domain-containing protein [Ramlibacter rhizophilus]|nr:DUF2917 domain-containing protein [Ramlibacter rhizophilus]
MNPASFLSAHQSSACPGAWKLPARQAMSLRPRAHGVLRVRQGKVWLTLGGPAGAAPDERADHVLEAGEQIMVRAWRHVVLEAWRGQEVFFDWEPLPQAAPQPAAAAVLEPLRELRAAAGLAAAAFGRLVAGLARLGWEVLGGRHNAAAFPPPASWPAPSPSSTTSSATRSWT